MLKASFLLIIWISLFNSDVLAIGKPNDYSEVELENLYVLAVSYGLIRYYYPVKNAQDKDWDLLLYNGINDAIKAENEKELAIALNEIFNPIAPTVIFYDDFEKTDSLKIRVSKENAGKSFYHYKHYGYGYHAYKGIQKIFVPYSSKIKRLKHKGKFENVANYPIPDSLYCVQIQNIGLIFPETVSKKNFQSIKKSNTSLTLPLDYSSRELRIMVVVNVWNILKHFYPYWEQLNLDWGSVLKQTLKTVSEDISINEFDEAVSYMIALTSDAHAGFWVNNKNRFEPEIDVAWIDAKLVITDFEKTENTKRISVGDILIKINDKDAVDVFKSHLTLKAHNSNHSKYKAAESILYSYKGDFSTYQLIDKNNDVYNVKLAHQYNWKNPKSNWNKTVTPIVKIDSSIYYASYTSKKDFTKNIPIINQAKGLIIDFRSYSGYLLRGLGHFSDSKINSPSFLYPIIQKYQDNQNLTYDTISWKLKTKKTKINVPVVFLIDGNIISMGETFTSMVKHYKLGTLIGENTAGITGEMNFVRLPGGSSFTFTGCKVLDQSGKVFFNLGIEPDYHVEKSIKGIQEGRDEILEKAIEILNAK